jgi:hypothetical protein
LQVRLRERRSGLCECDNPAFILKRLDGGRAGAHTGFPRSKGFPLRDVDAGAGTQIVPQA